jgi:hypothetical protein
MAAWPPAREPTRDDEQDSHPTAESGVEHAVARVADPSHAAPGHAAAQTVSAAGIPSAPSRERSSHRYTSARPRAPLVHHLRLMYLGGATFAWVSDYAQIYLVDVSAPVIPGLGELGPEIFAARYYLAPAGMVVYTADCLRQEVHIAIHDRRPEASTGEPLSAKPWTQVLETQVTFPSRHFTIGSPSRTGGERWGPTFTVPSESLKARISWRELDDDRYTERAQLADAACWQGAEQAIQAVVRRLAPRKAEGESGKRCGEPQRDNFVTCERHGVRAMGCA